MTTFDSTRSPLRLLQALPTADSWKTPGVWLAPALGMVLLFAGGLKLAGGDGPGAWGGLAGWALAAIELSAGYWLALRPASMGTWRLAVALWGVFTVVVVAKVWQGAGSCGCFGRLEVPPVWTLLFDAAVLAMLLARPWRQSVGLGPVRTIGVVVSLLTSLAVGLAMGSGHLGPPAWRATFGRRATFGLGSPGDIGLTKVGTTVGFDASKWVGRRLPIVDEIAGGEQLLAGSWVLVLHRPGCGVCAEVLSTVSTVSTVAVVSPAGQSSLGTRCALVSLSGEGNGDERGPGHRETDIATDTIRLSVRPGTEWYGETPTVLCLEAGMVTRAATGVAGKAIIEEELGHFSATKPRGRAIVGGDGGGLK